MKSPPFFTGESSPTKNENFTQKVKLYLEFTARLGAQ